MGAVAMLGVVEAAHETVDPTLADLQALEAVDRIVGDVLTGAKQCLG